LSFHSPQKGEKIRREGGDLIAKEFPAYSELRIFMHSSFSFTFSEVPLGTSRGEVFFFSFFSPLLLQGRSFEAFFEMGGR
jgi:hypothetical protein